MKQILVITFMLVLTSSYCQKSYFGVDGGINWAHQRISFEGFPKGIVKSTEVLQNIIRPSGGLFYNIHLSELFAIRIGAKYIGMGGAAKGQPDVNLRYLSAPISLHYAINSNLNINAGAYFNFLLNGNDTYIQGESIDSQFSKNDFGTIIGIEQKLYKNIDVGVNFYLGLKNIYVFDTWATKCTNRSIQFSLLYKFKRDK